MSDSTVEVILKARNEMAPGLDAGRNAVSQFADGTIGHFSRMSSAVFNLRNLIAGVAAGGAAKMIFTPVIEKEQALLALETVLGSAEAAKRRLAELDEANFGWAFGDVELAAASAQLERMGAAALASGPGLRMVAGAAVATSQPIGTMAAQLGFLRSQMDAGSDTFTRSAMQLQKQGVLSAEAGMQLRKMTEDKAKAVDMWKVVEADLERFNGSLQRFAGSTRGKLNEVSERWEDIRKKVGEAALPVLTRALDELAGELERLSANGELQAFAEDAAKALQGLYETVTRVSRFLLEHREAVLSAAQAYVAFRVITAATASILTLTTTLRTLQAAHAAAAAGATANAAAQASVGTAAATAAGPAGLGLLKTGLMAIGPTLVAAGVAGIVAEILAINAACGEANRAIDKLGPGTKGPGAQKQDFWQSLKDWLPATGQNEIESLPPDSPDGAGTPWIETPPISPAELDKAKAERAAAVGQPPPTPVPVADGAGQNEEEAALAAQLQKEAEDELERRQELRDKIAAKEAAQGREATRVADEQKEWEGAARERQFRESTNEYVAEMENYAARARQAQADVTTAQTDQEKEAAQAKLASAQRLATAEGEALKIRIEALRTSAQTFEDEAKQAKTKEDAALALALNPQATQRQQQSQEQTDRDAKREQDRLERRVKALREREMQRDEKGVWRDRFGKAATNAGQLALDWDEQRTKGKAASRNAAEAKDEADRAQAGMVAAQELLQKATVDLSGNVAGLRDEIAELRKEQGKPVKGPLGRMGETEIAKLAVGAGELADGPANKAAAKRRKLIAMLTGAGAPGDAAGAQPYMLTQVPMPRLPDVTAVPRGEFDLRAVVVEQQRGNALLLKIAQAKGVE